MELKKTNESIVRTFADAENATESIQSVQYEILNAEGATIGNAYVYPNSASLNISLSGFNGIDEGAAKIAAIFAPEAEATED